MDNSSLVSSNKNNNHSNNSNNNHNNHPHRHQSPNPNAFLLKTNETKLTLDSRSDLKNVCSMCQRPIREMYVLIVDKQMYHEDCLRCSCCEARLAELDKFCYLKANMMLCKRDYLRLYGSTGLCSACDMKIQAFEYVMRAKNNIYHLDCFTCHICKMRFCVGDKFYLHETNKILCEKDHNVILCFQTHSNFNNSSSNNNNNSNNNSNNNNSSSNNNNINFNNSNNNFNNINNINNNNNNNININNDPNNNNTANHSRQWLSSVDSLKPCGNLYMPMDDHHTTVSMNNVTEKIKTNNNNLSSWIFPDSKNDNLKTQSNSLVYHVTSVRPNCDSQISPSKFEDVSSGYDSPSPNSGTIVN